MAAITRDLAIEQGATYTLPFTWVEAVEVDGEWVPGDPYDLTGWTARMQIRRRQGAEVQIEATTENGKITLGGVAGTVLVKLEDEDTAELSFRTMAYDLELINPDGDVFRLLKGAVAVDPNITQDVDEPVVKG